MLITALFTIFLAASVYLTILFLIDVILYLFTENEHLDSPYQVLLREEIKKTRRQRVLVLALIISILWSTFAMFELYH